MIEIDDDIPDPFDRLCQIETQINSQTLALTTLNQAVNQQRQNLTLMNANHRHIIEYMNLLHGELQRVAERLRELEQ